MNFANYDAFRVNFTQLADGDDVSQASFSPTTADLIIGLGESRVYRDLRASTMVTALNLAPVATVYTLPSRLVALKELYFSGDEPIEIVPLDKLRKLAAAGVSSGQVRYAAQNGDRLEFWPTATENVLGSYYARPTLDLKDETTWAAQTTFARYPEVFLFAALAEMFPFVSTASSPEIYERQYMRAVARAHTDEQMRVYGGSPLRVRAR